jgi:uncharacterized protein involved in exopolysaccharide biosynthesis
MESLNTANLSLRKILEIVFKRKYQYLLFFLITVVSVTVSTFLAIPKYESTARILVKAGSENVHIPAGRSTSTNVFIDQEEIINSELEILRSFSLAEKVIEDIGPDVLFPSKPTRIKSIASLKSFFDKIISSITSKISSSKNEMNYDSDKLEKASQLEKFQKNLTASAILNSSIIKITFKHENPEVAALTVNRLADYYIEHRLNLENSNEAYDFFTQQSNLLKDKLMTSERKLEQYKKDHHITFLSDQQRILISRINDLRSLINSSKSAEAEQRNRIDILKKQIKRTPREINQEEAVVANSQVINTLQARLVDLELKEKELLTRYTESSLLVKNVREELSVVREKLSEHEGKLYGTTTKGVNPTFQYVERQLLESQAEERSLAARLEIMQEQLDAYTTELSQLNNVEIDFNRLQEEVQQNRENYRLYLREQEEFRIDQEKNKSKITNVNLADKGKVAFKPVSPKKKLNLMLGFLVAIFGGFFLILVFELLSDRLEYPEDIERLLNVPVLTSIPKA